MYYRVGFWSLLLDRVCFVAGGTETACAGKASRRLLVAVLEAIVTTAHPSHYLTGIDNRGGEYLDPIQKEAEY